MKYFGWQVGVTYGSGRPGGLDYAYFVNLLDEMAANSMNMLSLMMQSYGFYDYLHDGYSWPVRNPALAWYRDESAINAQPGGEFVQRIMQAAADRNISVDLFLNWGIWNPAKITKGYPNAICQQDRSGNASGWLHCPDSPDAWQAGLDEVADLLSYYSHPNVKRFTFERVGYQGNNSCFCPATQAAFRAETGQDLLVAPKSQLQAWKFAHVGRLLTQYITHVKNVKNGIQVGIHTQGKASWGHNPQAFPGIGADCVLPHTIQFKTSKRQLYHMLNYLAPNPCIMHFCARNVAPPNYPIWIKTPSLIHKVLGWVFKYPKDHVHGILFFNEPMVSRENKQAIYDELRVLRHSLT